MSAFSVWEEKTDDSKIVKELKSEIRKSAPHPEDLKSAVRNEADDKKFIADGGSDEEKAFREELISFLVVVNGSAASVVPGASRSYIPTKNFYQRVESKSMPRAEVQLVELALNWIALGKGDGGLYGASVRWALRDLFVKERECTVTVIERAHHISDLKEEMRALVASYVKAAKARGDTVGFWMSNASQVASLAGALQLSTGHHWDNNNRRPQDALLGALGQREDFSEEAKRPLFYLSVHPLPLRVIEHFRAAASSEHIGGFSPAVRMRANGVPAGFSVLQIAVAAFAQMKTERYYDQIAQVYGDDIKAANNLLTDIKARPTAYHVNAQDYGVEKIAVPDNACLSVKIIGVAYAQSVIKGTLGSAVAIAKFAAANSRQVNRWKVAFVNAVGDPNVTLEFMLGQ